MGSIDRELFMIGRSMTLLLACASLGGCAPHLGGSVSGGECKIMERPLYAVQGQQRYDQDWIDSTIEGGVGACGWKRPAPRPPELDAAPALPAKPPAVRPSRKPGLVKRIEQRVWPKTAVAPVAPVPMPTDRPVAADAPPPDPPLPAPEPPASKPKRPLTALEELLHLRPSDDE
jgi:hypothetical protein